MKRQQEWFKSISSLLAATLIVGAILGGFLYNAPGPIARKGPIDDSRASRAVAQWKHEGMSVEDNSTARSGRSLVRQRGSKEAKVNDTPDAAAADSWVRGERRQVDEVDELEDTASPGVTTAADSTRSVNAAAKSGSALRKMTVARWTERLRLLHLKLCKQGRGSETAKREVKERAESELEGIDDPQAVAGIWKVFAGTPSHHQLVARMLARIESPLSTRKLAELSVFSIDEKARWGAIGALRNRDPADFLDGLTSVFNHVKWHRESRDQPGVGREEALVIEQDRAIYRFVYPPPAKAPPPRDSQGVYTLDNPFMLHKDRQAAGQINQALEADARDRLAERITGDIEAAKRFEQESHELNDRALKALRQATGAVHLPPDREAWTRWFAELKGRQYVSQRAPEKELIVQVMPPLFNPSFISIPEPT